MAKVVFELTPAETMQACADYLARQGLVASGNYVARLTVDVGSLGEQSLRTARVAFESKAEKG